MNQYELQVTYSAMRKLANFSRGRLSGGPTAVVCERTWERRLQNGYPSGLEQATHLHLQQQAEAL